MSERLALYKCEVCGNLVQVLLSGGGELVCCGKPMTYLNPQDKSDEMLEEKGLLDKVPLHALVKHLILQNNYMSFF